MSTQDIMIVMAPFFVLLLGMILAFSIAFVNREDAL
jgi:hypothetical protein